MEWEVDEDLAAGQSRAVCWRLRPSRVDTGGGWRGPPLTVLVSGRWGGTKKHSLRCWELWLNQSQVTLSAAPGPHTPGCFFLRCLHAVGRAPRGFCQWPTGTGLFPPATALCFLERKRILELLSHLSPPPPESQGGQVDGAQGASC